MPAFHDVFGRLLISKMLSEKNYLNIQNKAINRNVLKKNVKNGSLKIEKQ